MAKLKYLLLLALAVASSFAHADLSISITMIADTNTPDPSGNGNFTGFGMPSSDRDDSDYQYLSPTDVYYNNNIYFTAEGANGLCGVYIAGFPAPGITEISTIADTTMTATTGGTFASFSNTSSGQSEAGFIAIDSNGIQGVYAFDGYGLHLIASSNTSPVAGSTFGSFQSISFISNGPPSFDAMGEIGSSAGIYDFAGDFVPSFTLVANTSTIPPGATTPFTSFGPVSYRASDPASNTPGYRSPERAVLATVNNAQGIYYYFENGSVPLNKLVDTNTPVPGGSGDFTSFGNPVATASYIEFTAGYSSTQGPQQGIFVYGPYLFDGNNIQNPDNPSLQEWLASGTLAPNSGGAHFASFLTLGNDEPGNGTLPHNENEIIPFLAALDNGQTGLYCTTGIDTSVKILETGDLFDGKTVSNIELSPDSSGLVFTTFEVGFTDGSSGIYYFDTNVLPEPAALCLFAFPIVLIRRRK